MADELVITSRDGLGMATVMARRTADIEELGRILGGDLPTGPRTLEIGRRAILGTAPRVWFVVEEGAGSDFAETLDEGLGPLASVSDQSSAYDVIRLVGAGARIILQRGAAIDFAPEAFSPGSAVVTMIAHIGVIIRQVDDRPTYDVATFRSLSRSFRRWLDHAAAAL